MIYSKVIEYCEKNKLSIAAFEKNAELEMEQLEDLLKNRIF